MNWRDAVIRVLEEADKPLHNKEITKRILANGSWTTNGKTPWDTITAQISTDIRTNGTRSCFVRASPGWYGLNKDVLVPSSDKQKPHFEPVPPEPQQTMTFLDAAEDILKRHGGAEGMHYLPITTMALDEGILTSGAKTPHNTMIAQLTTDIIKRERLGTPARFVKLGGGFYRLAKVAGGRLEHDIEGHNRKVREALHEQLWAMDPKEFEQLAGQLLEVLGFEEVEVTQYSKDKGIDVRGVLVVASAIRTKIAVQVKRYGKTNGVQSQEIRQLRGSLGAHEQGLFITTGKFSKGAQDEAARPGVTPIALIDGKLFVSLLIEHDIMITRTRHDLIELDDEGSI